MGLVMDNDSGGRANDKARSNQVVTVAEMRAGMRPTPGLGEDAPPGVKMLLLGTGAMKPFEDELAARFGPEEAHRLAFSDEMCMGRSVHRTRPKKKGGDMASDNVDDVTR
jgi:hypothetical protein